MQCLHDSKQLLSEKLAGLNWVFISYSKPGVALAAKLAKAFADGVADIVVLENHGIVTGGDTLEEALEVFKGRLRQMLSRAMFTKFETRRGVVDIFEFGISVTKEFAMPLPWHKPSRFSCRQ